MERKQHLGFLVGVALLTGLIGGTLSHYVATPWPVRAEEETQDKEPRRITAEEFRIVGSNGEIRARLAISSRGSVFLRLFDENGEDRVTLEADADTSRLILSQETDRATVDSRSLKFDSQQPEPK